MITAIFWVVLIHLIFINGEPPVYDCDSDIFCYGPILQQVQTLNIFKGSKNFFNKKLKYQYEPDTIKTNFKEIKWNSNNNVAIMSEFADKYFEDEELLFCSGFETRVMPNLQSLVTNAEYQEFVNKISTMWPILAVKNHAMQTEYMEHHASVYLPHCFIKADQFTPTMNYNDSYWIIRGLLANGLNDMAAKILRNYADLIFRFGYVLQSNRIYSRRRTQIPLLCLMVEAYVESTGHLSFVTDMFPLEERDAEKPTAISATKAMEEEFHWWKANRLTEVIGKKKIYNMFRYKSEVKITPRPEEYTTDLYMAESYLRLQPKKENFYAALRALDESGFGLSSRFIRNYNQVKKVKNKDAIWVNLDVSSLIPVELNCVMERYARMLGKWIRESLNPMGKDEIKANNYEIVSGSLRSAIDEVTKVDRENLSRAFDELQIVLTHGAEKGKIDSYGISSIHIKIECFSVSVLKTLELLDRFCLFMKQYIRYNPGKLLWDNKENMWYDWDEIKKVSRKTFSITNLMPLFTTSYDESETKYSKGALEYLKRNGIIISDDNLKNSAKYLMIPTTMENSGSNWDFPFGSPSLNAFVIEGLKRSKDKECMEVAEELAKVLVKTCYEGYKTQGSLFKEYYSVKMEERGLGAITDDSEISAAGYASTNGALLALFKTFGESLNPTDYSHLVTPAPQPGDEQPEGQEEALPSSSTRRKSRKPKRSDVRSSYYEYTSPSY